MNTQLGMESSVGALKRLAQGRDAEAWEVLLNRHGGEIFRACRKILGEEALAEDACQETLLQLRDRAGQFRGGAQDPERLARAWIMRTACTTALQMLRKRRLDQAREQTHARRKE